jgi:PhzF family phenazine biosynthesis protein
MEGEGVDAGTVTVVDTVVFERAPGGGNPCPLVLEADTLETSDMQALAARWGHETGFLLRPTVPAARVRLRYFVPRYEMSMCVHATVAAVTWLYRTGLATEPSVVVETPLGLTTARCDLNAGDLQVWVELWPPRYASRRPPVTQVAEVLGVRPEDIRADWPICTLSTSRMKTLVPLVSRATLEAMRAPGDEAWRLLDAYGSTGFYPFAPVQPGHHTVWACRQFPVRAGYPEDPATGVAAGALAAYLADRLGGDTKPGGISFEMRQGDAMGRPSVIWANARRDPVTSARTVRVGGQARIVARHHEAIL